MARLVFRPMKLTKILKIIAANADEVCGAGILLAAKQEGPAVFCHAEN
jgi:hypothetical protein